MNPTILKEAPRNRSHFLAEFDRIRETTEFLCHPLQTEDYVVQPIEDVSPPKWHLGHTTWFFESNILKPFSPRYRLYHEKFNFLFNSYYESFGPRTLRSQRGFLSRPTVKEIYEYRRYINDKINQLSINLSEEDWVEFVRLMNIGLQHEQQHQELLITDLKFIFGNNPLKPFYYKQNTSPEMTQPSNKKKATQTFLGFHGGIVPFGFSGKGFAFDNEKPSHQVYLPEYKLMNRLITNGEYLEFIQDGGYRNFRLWLSDGWELVNRKNWEAPLYWEKEGGKWFLYSLNGFKELNLEEPVCHISFYEADAYARWAKKRLPTEVEWENAARIHIRNFDDANLLDDHHFHPQVLANSPLQNRSTLKQMIGDVWEWTSSSYLPYPGFQPEEGVLGEYNGKFMINQMVLRGGSCATPRSHIRISYRNFFQPDKRWQFSGIRLASD
ncbi:hypothetical protein BVX98_06410 [bacterium F11]|nr:hypothetical protein BVX98_06410 [bacterium F11]